MLATLLLLAAATPAAVPSGAVKPAVSDVVAEARSFQPEAGDKVSWRYRTAGPSAVTAAIYDGRDVLIRALLKEEALPAGDHRLAWDGRDDGGRPAPPGYYLLTI